MTREEAIQFAKRAQTMTDIPEAKEFYAMAETALRQQEHKRARWEWCHEENTVICSLCKNEHYIGTYHQYEKNYCPNCGAEMSNGGIFHETS